MRRGIWFLNPFVGNVKGVGWGGQGPALNGLLVEPPSEDLPELSRVLTPWVVYGDAYRC